MPDLEQERAHLALADQHISEGERRVADQTRLIEHLTEQGHETARWRRAIGEIASRTCCA